MKRTDSGFSFLELLIVIIIAVIIAGATFSTINTLMQRSATEQTKLDMFQEARQFMDQMSRDLRQAGYPSPRNMDASVLTTDPIINDHKAAAGLVKVGPGDLWFEGDTDSTGRVFVVHYHLDTSTDNGCPCLRRSEVEKQDGDPLSGQAEEEYQIEVQGVQNTDVFSAYNNGAALTLPLDITTNAGADVSKVDTVQAMITLRAAAVDPKTRKKPLSTLVMTVRLNNCSQAAIGFKTSCQ
jgi:prepilin-type N-terminal cleavage/methylation domain-containing protein